MAVEPSKCILNDLEKLNYVDLLLAVRDCSVIKRVVVVVALPISPVSKNRVEDARIVTIIVSKHLPKKKDLADPQ
jgi:hypothetical protein